MMRATFVLTHQPGEDFVFADYILESMDEDFAKVSHIVIPRLNTSQQRGISCSARGLAACMMHLEWFRVWLRLSNTTLVGRRVKLVMIVCVCVCVQVVGLGASAWFIISVFVLVSGLIGELCCINVWPWTDLC